MDSFTKIDIVHRVEHMAWSAPPSSEACSQGDVEHEQLKACQKEELLGTAFSLSQIHGPSEAVEYFAAVSILI